MKPAILISSLFLLAGCASTPVLKRAALPVAPSTFAKPVALPTAKKGESVKVFALKNRAALHEANHRLEADGEFWAGVVEGYGEPE